MGVRREVWGLGSPWNDTLLWYARAVGDMQSRPISQKTSWRYLAAMHGFDARLWQSFGFLRAGEALPGTAEQRRYWQQCQHQSWYFLPWHRAYLWSFETIVRQAVVARGGPADWSLPYWNYSASTANALRIPPAFLQRRLPTGEPNPLFVNARFGTRLRADLVDLRGRLEDHDFTGIDSGVGMGIGGPRTAFSHAGSEEGLIEAQPHDVVHGAIGGRGGLMSDPRLAALDPIFWLHHANIDRLWEVWTKRDPGNRNPEDARWRNGPADRPFAVFDANGRDVASTPKDVVSTVTLGYTYEDTSDPIPGPSRQRSRIEMLRGGPSPAAGAMSPQGAPAELMGASEVHGLALGPQPVTATLKVSPAPAQRVSSSLTRSRAAAQAHQEPDRVFLRLENIRGDNGSALFDVYLAQESGQQPGAQTHIGVISLFGLEQASDPGGPHGGQGLTKAIEITDFVDALHLTDETLPDTLQVRIVPRSDVRPEDRITVGQISLYRRGG